EKSRIWRRQLETGSCRYPNCLSVYRRRIVALFADQSALVTPASHSTPAPVTITVSATCDASCNQVLFQGDGGTSHPVEAQRTAASGIAQITEKGCGHKILWACKSATICAVVAEAGTAGGSTRNESARISDYEYPSRLMMLR